ncbi:hypothetical protein BVX97_03695 [bacterium E08(2017)]|nr:hypothetical protein BVX97_03695 [bacterium E08(2017)]
MKLCYGIDISGSEPVVVRAERLRGREIISSVSVGMIEEGAACCGSMPVRSSFSRWIEVPFASERKARKVLPTLLDIQLPFPLEECSYDFPRFSSDAGSVSALGVGARRGDISQRLSEYTDKGFDIQVLDHEGIALWERALVEQPAGADGRGRLRILVNLGNKRSTLVIGKGGKYMNSHSVRSDDGGRVTRLLDIGFKGENSDRVEWIFCGAAASDNNAVESFMALAGKWCNGKKQVLSDSGTFLARAVAVRGLDDTAPCNLRSGEDVHPAVMRAMKRKTLVPLFGVAAAGVLLICSNLVAVGLLQTREDGIDKRFKSLANEVAGYNVRAMGEQAILKVERKVEERAAATAPFMMAFDAPLTGLLQKVMDLGSKKGLKYEVVSLGGSADGTGDVLIRGTAPGWNDCDSLIAMLKSRGYPVKLDRGEALADESIPFTLRTGGGK